MKFERNQRVVVTNCLQLSGGQVWKSAVGTVKTAKNGHVVWYWVAIDNVDEQVPFKESELSAADEDNFTQDDALRLSTVDC